MSNRKMESRAFYRTQTIIYKLFGSAWRIPKSLRDNYRKVRPVDHVPYRGRPEDENSNQQL